MFFCNFSFSFSSSPSSSVFNLPVLYASRSNGMNIPTLSPGRVIFPFWITSPFWSPFPTCWRISFTICLFSSIFPVIRFRSISKSYGKLSCSARRFISLKCGFTHVLICLFVIGIIIPSISILVLFGSVRSFMKVFNFCSSPIRLSVNPLSLAILHLCSAVFFMSSCIS